MNKCTSNGWQQSIHVLPYIYRSTLVRKHLIKMVAVFVSLLYPLIMHAQTIEEIIQDEEQYIWGEGLGATQKEAKENDWDVLGVRTIFWE